MDEAFFLVFAVAAGDTPGYSVPCRAATVARQVPWPAHLSRARRKIPSSIMWPKQQPRLRPHLRAHMAAGDWIAVGPSHVSEWVKFERVAHTIHRENGERPPHRSYSSCPVADGGDPQYLAQ